MLFKCVQYDEKRSSLEKDGVSFQSAKIEQVIKLIYVTGKGTKDSPVREVVEFWTLDGECIAVFDPQNAI